MDLIVIEAPGKLGALRLALAKCGMSDTLLFATRGHLAGMPPKLWPVGIDDQLVERLRGARDPARVEKLRDKARMAIGTGGRVLVATDADAEGDAIAWDVKQALAPIVRGEERVQRMRMRGLDVASVRLALEKLEPVSRLAAVPGRSRSIVDRVLGAAFSGRGRVVGRVTTALLAAVESRRPAVQRARLALPAADAGRPFIARIPVAGGITEDVARHLVERRWKAVGPGRLERSAPPPPHMGDLLLAGADQMGLPVMETASAMQRLYEEGRLSYPRAGHRVLSQEASSRVSRLARHGGCVYDERLVPRPGQRTVHDAPYPLVEVPLTADPSVLGTDEAVLLLAARGAVSSGVARRVEHVDPAMLADAVQDLPVDVRDVLLRAQWTRDSGTRWPGREDWQDPGIERRAPDAVALECMLADDLGRPSTWPAHADAFAYRGLVDDQLRLTDKGRAWLEAAPEAMRSADFAKRLEVAFEWGGAGEGWSERARRALEEGLPEVMQARVWAMLAREAERLGREHGLGADAEDQLEWTA